MQNLRVIVSHVGFTQNSALSVKYGSELFLFEEPTTALLPLLLAEYFFTQNKY